MVNLTERVQTGTLRDINNESNTDIEFVPAKVRRPQSYNWKGEWVFLFFDLYLYFILESVNMKFYKYMPWRLIHEIPCLCFMFYVSVYAISTKAIQLTTSVSHSMYPPSPLVGGGLGSRKINWRGGLKLFGVVKGGGNWGGGVAFEEGFFIVKYIK